MAVRFGRATKRLLGFLGSLRLATLLLVLLTLACILGGVIPQSSVTPNADLLYRSYGIFWYRLITRLRLDDVFHSLWLLSLTGLFALNLLLCTSRRARGKIARVFRAPGFRALSETDSRTIAIPFADPTPSAFEHLDRVVRRAGYHRVVRREFADGRAQLIARRWPWGALGADVVHLGILVILAGALLGVFREEGTVRVDESERGLLLPACAEQDRGADCLPFDLLVDDFGVETYGETGQAKDYWAAIAAWQGDRLLEEARISVNRPTTIRGVGLYVWRYGAEPGAALVRLHVVDPVRSIVTAEVELRVGETLPVPGAQLWVSVVQFYRTFSLDEEGNPVDLGDVPGGHSAVLLQVSGLDATGEGVAYRDLALPFLPETTTQPEVAFLLVDAQVPAFIDLHFARNPGYPVFWWGFVLVMAGLAVALYVRPSTVRITIEPERLLLRAEGRGGSRRADRLAADLATLFQQDLLTEAEE